MLKFSDNRYSGKINQEQVVPFSRSQGVTTGTAYMKHHLSGQRHLETVSFK